MMNYPHSSVNSTKLQKDSKQNTTSTYLYGVWPCRQFNLKLKNESFTNGNNVTQDNPQTSLLMV